MIEKKSVTLKKKTPHKREEECEQIKFVIWLQKKGFRLHHSPNGGRRSIVEGAKFKRMGTSAGFPDIEVPYPCGKYHGFYIEMKPEKGGNLSSAQQEWLNYLREKGYFAEKAHGFLEAKEMFEHYISLNKG